MCAQPSITAQMTQNLSPPLHVPRVNSNYEQQRMTRAGVPRTSDKSSCVTCWIYFSCKHNHHSDQLIALQSIISDNPQGAILHYHMHAKCRHKSGRRRECERPRGPASGVRAGATAPRGVVTGAGELIDAAAAGEVPGGERAAASWHSGRVGPRAGSLGVPGPWHRAAGVFVCLWDVW